MKNIEQFANTLHNFMQLTNVEEEDFGLLEKEKMIESFESMKEQITRMSHLEVFNLLQLVQNPFLPTAITELVELTALRLAKNN